MSEDSKENQIITQGSRKLNTVLSAQMMGRRKERGSSKSLKRTLSVGLMHEIQPLCSMEAIQLCFRS